MRKTGPDMQKTSPWLIAARVIFTFALIACIVFIFSNSMAVADVSSVSSGRVLQLLQANPWKRLLLLHRNLLITWQLLLLLLKVLLIPQPVWKSLILPKALWKSAWASMVKAVAVLSR